MSAFNRHKSGSSRLRQACGAGAALVAILVTATLTVPLSAHAADERAEPDADAIRFFETHVRPVLANNCYECHGPEEQESNLRLDGLDTILKGGERGPAVVPGDPANSLLLAAVRHEHDDVQMPPDAKLSDKDIAALAQWVRAGAPWPADEGRTRLESRHDAFEITDEDRAYWAFAPIERPAEPTVEREEWVSNPIDAFILARLEEAGLEPNEPATRRELVRRVYFDLIGLPPTAEQVESFVRDPSPDAYERLIDRLLARPQYGERWGRYWLDVVRFAQTEGYERDNEKPYAWRYRDYVIDSFNEDKPYDRFILEQLAGDELEDRSPESLIATGFYRIGVWDDEPDDALMAEYDYLDDIVRTTGAAFLGLTLDCARCHDHMFDPIPQTDYYRFLAFFRNVRHHEAPRHRLDSAVLRPLAPEEQVEAWKAEQDEKIAALEWELAALEPDEELDDAEESDEADEELTERREKIEERIEAARNERPPFDFALAIREHGPEPKPARLLARGDPHSEEGDPLDPAFLSVVDAPPPDLSGPSAGAETTGRRRALADWIASPDNPLTARVMANRLWQHHFGHPIAPTPNDFGRAGIPPTHPELLDYLASELIDGGWTLKRMHKLIMTSSAYRMSSRADNEAALAEDPGNERVWRQNMRRLSAEAIRDAILAVSGNLNDEMGGRGIFPRLSAEVIAGASRPGHGWSISDEEQSNRRSVYIYVKRTMLEPFLETFDYVNTAAPLDVRPTTTVAPQALMLLNSEFTQRNAATLADRLLEEAGDDPAAQVAAAYRIALGRAPSDHEKQIALDYLERHAAMVEAMPPRASFTPMVPVSVHRSYLDQLDAADLLAGPDAGWTYHRGRWGGGYEGIEVAELDRGPFALWEGGDFTDVEIEASFQLHSAAKLGGLIFRARPTDEESFIGYELLLDPDNDTAELRRHGEAEDDVTTLAAADLPVETARWYDVRIEAAGDRFRVWLDGGEQPLLDATDPEPITEPGRIGARAWGAAVSIEDLTVRTEGSAPVSAIDASPAPERARAALRALALVMLNLNEFVYID